MTTTDIITHDEATSIIGPLIGTNTRTKAELLNDAKAAIERGDQSLREAAEALALLQELHGASQAEMARAVGKSEAWVSLLLQWRRTDYKAESPFGPKTKAARLKHAKNRAASGAAKPRKARAAAADTSASTTSDAPVKATANGADASAKALAEFKYAVNLHVPKMNDAAKKEASAYFLEKAGVP